MHSPAEFSDALLERYDRPGPRYTSYPTAPHFRSDFSRADLQAQAALSNARQPARPLSLYVHVPYCQSPCFYCGCTRVITRDLSRGDAYVQRLLREARQVAPLMAPEREVVQLHLGGGTPNFLQPAALQALLAGLAQVFRLSQGAERDFSIELDPRTVPQAAEHYAGQLASLGFNRVSIGVQDFDPEVQRAVNRVQSAAQTLELIAACRTHGFRSVNVDLIYGLPRQTLAGFLATLRAVTAARPDRIAIYGYAHLPEAFKAQRRIQAAELPDAKSRIALLRLAIEELGAAGYHYVGMDHFALPEDELVRAQARGTLQRNFMGYTTHAGCDLLGLGASAISSIGHSYSQNLRELRAWERAIDTGASPLWRGLLLSEDDRLRATVIGQLMCHGRIELPPIEAAFGIRFWEYFAAARGPLERQAADGLLTSNAHEIATTAAGRLLLRHVAACFDRYLPQAPSRVMSRVI